jgi:hypothetical protein
MVVQDRVYKCLNPVGNQEPVDLYPLAPRLKSLDGKTVHLSICGEAAEGGLPEREVDGEEAVPHRADGAHGRRAEDYRCGDTRRLLVTRRSK